MEVLTPPYLMTSGPYAVSRNPMYVAELSLWLGWAILFGSVAVLVGLVVLGVAMQGLVPWEEHSLERFGEAYRRYKATVPRWLGRAQLADRGGEHPVASGCDGRVITGLMVQIRSVLARHGRRRRPGRTACRPGTHEFQNRAGSSREAKHADQGTAILDAQLAQLVGGWHALTDGGYWLGHERVAKETCHDGFSNPALDRSRRP